MKSATKPDFQTYPEDYDSYFERAIEEGSFDVRLNRRMICEKFSQIEKEIYQKRYMFENQMLSVLSADHEQLTQAELEQVEKFDREFERNSFLSEKNYVLFVYLKQCEQFQADLERYNLNINHLETNDDTEKLVDLFIKNYKLLELITPSNPLSGAYSEDTGLHLYIFVIFI